MTFIIVRSFWERDERKCSRRHTVSHTCGLVLAQYTHIQTHTKHRHSCGSVLGKTYASSRDNASTLFPSWPSAKKGVEPFSAGWEWLAGHSHSFPHKGPNTHRRSPVLLERKKMPRSLSQLQDFLPTPDQPSSVASLFGGDLRTKGLLLHDTHTHTETPTSNRFWDRASNKFQVSVVFTN